MDLIVSKEVAFERASICNECDRLFRATWTCKECGCFMKVKVRVPSAHCALPEPDRKW